MTEETVNRGDDDLDPRNATLAGMTDADGGERIDDGQPVGGADADADRARSGAADSDELGQGAAPSLFAPGSPEGEEASDDGVAVGSADRDTDVERSS
jgi:hypothetical protein